MAMRIKSNAQKSYVVLTTVQSESGSWEYEIRTSLKDGRTYCTCQRWAFHKTCKHIDAYNGNPTIAVISDTKTAKRRTPGDVLRDELSMLGVTISAASANAISTKVLNAGGKQASGDVSSDDVLNTANVRVIVLPD